jgi:hypothetical protein
MELLEYRHGTYLPSINILLTRGFVSWTVLFPRSHAARPQSLLPGERLATASRLYFGLLFASDIVGMAFVAVIILKRHRNQIFG